MADGSQKDLLKGAAVAGAIGAAAAAGDAKLSARAKAKAPKPKTEIQKKREQLARRRRQAKPPKRVHPKQKLAEQARSANPAMFKKIIKGQRLAARAAKARARGMGALGVVANAPGMIRDAQSITAEGGKFAARFGKFVERSLGLPAGTTGRPRTDKEQRASTLY